MKTLTRLTERAARALVSHTAQPLTAGRVHIHEVKIVKIKTATGSVSRLKTGEGTRVKSGRQRTREAQGTGRMFPHERLETLRKRAAKAREKSRRTEQLGLREPPQETNP